MYKPTMRQQRLPIACSCLFMLLFTQAATAQFIADVETGAVFNGPYNEIRIPSSEGTTFDAFGDNFQTDPALFGRLRAGYTFNERHTVVALYGPLTAKSASDGAINRPIAFQGTTFGAGRALEVEYTFNSYRLTYRYHFVRRENFKFGAGFTGQIREATIQLDNGEVRERQENVGFVPLINFYLNWLPTKRFGFLLEGDALVAPLQYGRAEDIFAGVNYHLTDKLALKAGYRVLEGGSNNDETYNLVWLNFASLGVTWGL